MSDKVKSETALGATIEARIAELLRDPRAADLAHTFVDTPAVTVRPNELGHRSVRGRAAVDALRAKGKTLHTNIEIHKTLGEGGMGVVRLATQATVGRHVAVKTLKSDVSSEEATLRMLREAWVTGTLEHPNVVPVYDVGVDERGAPIIVMKRIEGQEWGQLVHAHDEILKRFPVQSALDWNLRILGSVCNAVHFAHSRGILHRDLKPDNVMIGAFGEVYLLDWGIAVSLEDDATGRLPLRDNATDIAGTPHYMAPEMLLGEPMLLSVRTDVYLLGAVLYEIFVGKPPHEGGDLRAMVAHILGSELDFPVGIPVEVREICTRAMQRVPEERYESADAFRHAIEEYVRHRGSRRLAEDARKSHELLEESLRREPDETSAEEIARLLGECRFGYRAAISAWRDNAEAKQGLDEALLLVLEHSLTKGDVATCEGLLRELDTKPRDIVDRVAAAKKAKSEHDVRLQQLETDLDATIGTRTRSFLGVLFGGLWTSSPLLGWAYVGHGGVEPRFFPVVLPFVFLCLGSLAFLWARETLTKTLYNRQIMTTAGVCLATQTLLSLGGCIAGLPPTQIHVMSMAAWGLNHALVAVWAESSFAFVAATCAVSFLVASRFPSVTFPLMSLDNLVLTIVVVRAWLPKGEIGRLRRQGLLYAHRQKT